MALTICDVFQLKMEDVFVLNKEGKRMNRIVSSYIINVLYTALACWTFVEFYSVITELADIIKTRNSRLKYGLMEYHSFYYLLEQL